MNYPRQKVRLLARNEGKIKSYDSCNDVRAWSHDVGRRDRYLREWMKCDMPFCVMPVCTLAGFLRTMTCRSRGRATPRCHPDCKSKVLLDSISKSCHAMKECLKNDDNFEKYFLEEELETSHWPCERCLEALKSIKLFWKVMVEKIFNIKLPKTDNAELEEQRCCRTDSVRSVARIWQRDMVHQALFFKTISPQLSCKSSKSRVSCECKKSRPIKKASISPIPKLRCTADSGSILSRKSSKSTVNSNRSQRTRVTISDPMSCANLKSDRSPRKKVCCTRCTSVRVKTIDMGCDACNVENEELKAYKINLEFLQRNFDLQTDEISKLKKENTSLKVELRNVHRSCKWNSSVYCPVLPIKENDSGSLVPKPFENIDEKCVNCAKDIDSEMIITMKNCKNDNYRHVSLLQVLHKTNDPIPITLEGDEYKKEDPINLLTKVQNTLGAMVRREMTIASGKWQCGRKSDIEASFQRVNASRSAPSCTTLSSCWPSHKSNFVT